MFARSRRLLLGLSALLVAAAGHAGVVELTAEGYEFHEPFTWQGNHAATIAGGASTTVWWDEASWDVRGDSASISVTPVDEMTTNRFHVDIHRAASPDLTNGALGNTVYAVNGNGDPGVGVMHLEYQDILDARLRNPLLVSAERPAVIEFYASTFVHTAFWWEIALTPADRITGGELTSVPGQNDAALPGPLGGAQPGPGHDAPLDSINLVSIGATDVPCTTGWWTRFAVTRTVAGTTTHFVNQVGALNELTPTDPSLADTLVEWRLEILPTSMRLLFDPEDDGTFEEVDSWAVSVPWPQVFVHLLGVAYQADHHPQGACYQGHHRELKWRDVRVFPVRYAATDVVPKNAGTQQVPKQQGWMAYDLRDIQRFGPPINGVPQPNDVAFTTANSGRYCNDAGYPCFDDDTSASLSFVPPQPAAGRVLAAARLLADLKRPYSAVDQPVQVALAGNGVGAFEPAGAATAAEGGVWVRRGLALPVARLQPGVASDLLLTLGQGAYLDRLEVELYFDGAPLPPTGALAFHTLTPCRLVDTRLAPGPLGGPALAAQSERQLPLTGICGVPPTAKALSLNVTVITPDAAGLLTFFPAGTPLPATSTVNYRAGQTRGNNAVLRLNDVGALAVRSGQLAGTAHLAIDVNGWFE